MSLRSLLTAFVAVSAVPSTLAELSIPEGFGPSAEVAAQRGPQVFNSVYDALRKWGAVVHPNGMSLFLATVPEGVMLHHGNNRNQTPTELDWLAYEIEHSEMFARPRGPPGGPPGSPPDREGALNHHHERRKDDQAPLFDYGAMPLKDESASGWLHTYRTTRPLRFLYIDGMSGNKGSSGVSDTQDFLLRGVRNVDSDWPPSPKDGKSTRGPPGEHQRAMDLCELCAEWDLQGVIRTESPGFEIIKCNFFDGLEQIQSLQRSGTSGNRPPGPPRGDKPGRYGGPGKPRGPGGPGGPGGGGWRRDEADRNREIGSSRTLLDYSSMVSAYFFPVNITNPDSSTPGIPRLVNTTQDEMAAVKAYLAKVVKERRDVPISSFNWRDIADLVVRRYAPRLPAMANKTESVEDMAQQIRFLLEVFIDYSVEDAETRDVEAQERCATFYLQTMPIKTDADRFIYAAFKAVNEEICAALFKVRSLVVLDPDAGDEVLAEAKSIVNSLMSYLAWTVLE